MSSRKAGSSRLSDAIYPRGLGRAAVPLMNVNNDYYVVNITLGGHPFPCMVDTGSSDLLVDGVVPGSQNTGHTANPTFGSGAVFGNILEAPFSFAGYNVPHQTFLSVTDSIDILNGKDAGLIGLEPPISTAISQLAISETLPGFESVLQQTALPLPLSVAREIAAGESLFWKTYTDPNGVLGPDGQPIILESQVPGAPNGTVVVTFDSGTSLPYLSAPGSAIGNPELDPVNGVAMCYGLVISTYSTRLRDSISRYAFGVAFLRDVYILQDYGDMIFGSSTDQVPPFIKMLSITDPVEAHDDFINVRIDNNPNAPLKGQIKPVEALARSRSDLSVSNGGRVTQRLWFHVVVCVVSALLLSLGIYVLVQRLRRRDPGRDPMDRDDIKRFLFGQGDRKYRSMGAAVPVGIDDENDRQRLDINMAEKGVGGEDVVPLTQAQYEDPFRDDAYKK
ncbi:hypothetical protein FRB98_005248 [Tulasnella sp. 332]|nr:hypothetical protein FRB98_005248 [Tulasnella sp. 332]